MDLKINFWDKKTPKKIVLKTFQKKRLENIDLLHELLFYD